MPNKLGTKGDIKPATLIKIKPAMIIAIKPGPKAQKPK